MLSTTSLAPSTLSAATTTTTIKLAITPDINAATTMSSATPTLATLPSALVVYRSDLRSKHSLIEIIVVSYFNSSNINTIIEYL